MTKQSDTPASLINNPTVMFWGKLIGIGFFAGVTWNTIDSRFDKMENEIHIMRTEMVTLLNEHVLADGYEKQAIRGEIVSIRQAIDKVTDDVKKYHSEPYYGRRNREFVRPEEVRRRSYTTEEDNEG